MIFIRNGLKFGFFTGKENCTTQKEKICVRKDFCCKL